MTTRNRRFRPYGLWTSNLKPEDSAGDLRLSDVAWLADSSTLVWLEERSDRGVVACAPAETGVVRELTPPGLNVRARLGYGGGDFAVNRTDLYFVSDGRIFRDPLAPGSKAIPITPASAPEPACPTPSPAADSLIYIVSDGASDSLRIVDSAGFQAPETLDDAHGFYMQPRWRPSGESVAWVSWDNPNMPWEGSGLYLANLQRPRGRARLRSKRLIAGDPSGAVAVAQPEFSPDGRYLAYVSDETGWFNLHILDLESGLTIHAADDGAEHCQPAWTQGQRSYAWAPDGRSLYLIRSVNGFQSLARYFPGIQAFETVGGRLSDYTVLSQIAIAASGAVALIASSAQRPPEVIALDAEAQLSVVRKSCARPLPKSQLSRAKPWNSGLAGHGQPGGGGNHASHGLYYPPCNPNFYGTGLPPAVIRVHGGPTSQYLPGYHVETQFLTSRGFAVLELNYRGSSGYGRPYRDLLRGRWGVIDVEDLCAAGAFLAQSGLADPKRIAATGSSAGGFTVLNALIRCPDVFKAAVCLFPVCDLTETTDQTHKFERHYLRTLIGEDADPGEYARRSPSSGAGSIRGPLALYHGADDKAVPAKQSVALAEQVQAHGGICQCTIFSGEGHGWRKSETIRAYYRSLETFLRRYLLDCQDQEA
jgi:dipeptidyl aminopeptidase/acylaminoacyl peptidase